MPQIIRSGLVKLLEVLDLWASIWLQSSGTQWLASLCIHQSACSADSPYFVVAWIIIYSAALTDLYCGCPDLMPRCIEGCREVDLHVPFGSFAQY